MKTSKTTKFAQIATAAVAAAISFPAAAHACGGQDQTTYVTRTFQTPTGNIACHYQVGFDSNPTVGHVSCEVRQHTWVAPDDTCTGPYNDARRTENAEGGDEFTLFQGARTPATLSCYWGSGPLRATQKSTLDYGQTLAIGAITCDSELSGVTCTDSSTGHFFRVSVESYGLG